MCGARKRRARERRARDRWACASGPASAEPVFVPCVTPVPLTLSVPPIDPSSRAVNDL